MPRQTKRPPRPRRTAPSSPRRDEIRAAAARVFAELSFRHSTMRDIGDASGAGTGSLYHHFTSKDEILLELLERFYDDIVTDLRATIDSELDPLTNITNMIRLALRYVVERRDESRILLNDYPYIAQSEIFESLNERIRTTNEIWLDMIRAAIAAGQVRPDAHVQIVFSSLFGAIFSSLRFYDPHGRIAKAKYIEEMTRELLDGLRVRAD